MIANFLIDRTPAHARSLIRLARVFPIRIDEALKDLAKTDLIDPALVARFNLGRAEEQAVQGIIDCGGRAILVAHEPDHDRILNAVVTALKPENKIVCRTDTYTKPVEAPGETCWVQYGHHLPSHPRMPEMKHIVVAVAPDKIGGEHTSLTHLSSRLFGALRIDGEEEIETVARFKPHKGAMGLWPVYSSPLFNIFIA